MLVGESAPYLIAVALISTLLLDISPVKTIFFLLNISFIKFSLANSIIFFSSSTCSLSFANFLNLFAVEAEACLAPLASLLLLLSLLLFFATDADVGVPKADHLSGLITFNSSNKSKTSCNAL